MRVPGPVPSLTHNSSPLAPAVAAQNIVPPSTPSGRGEPRAGIASTGVVPSGTQLGYAPKWKGSLAVDYRIRDVGPVDVLLGAQTSFQSKQIAQFDASAVIRNATTIDGYGLVDLSAGIVDKDDRYRVLLQIKNLFDTSFASAIATRFCTSTWAKSRSVPTSKVTISE